MKRKLISLKATSAQNGFTIHAWRKWVRLRRLPSYKIGGRVMLDEGEVERFIEANRVPARDE